MHWGQMTEGLCGELGKNWRIPPLLTERALGPFQLKGGVLVLCCMGCRGFIRGFWKEVGQLELSFVPAL